ncbi:2-polyprenyl-6-methoxyphenol hydroxylase-like FAD-dependent oxidoreductase [Actinoalloteichus hoggarensis]|uniref:6-hydroxynicotinate 3-monooxygenase n=1 Tax=Actinoalloteichus hoggarensis TaxID=1470176 RepID=A0A221W4J5_9PSEU|nr:FAD-dependent monooxygenase [Actinoalloteichus hoggarensis]ASO20810.1 6-hydroxynicotinate 3-monooxygenase precursor [Actinoalloteichus hoggarensis]MBB5920740.1 2-polyprenyl-6-methoxyphenol hydroxylase-like FAD-dependent oxidoreductase [Actinoalloteichus hoggarensis]
MTRTVLISGAGIAGSVAAYWLSRGGFVPTVVEKAPDLRRTGGHAVDLAGVAIEVIERMGLLPAVQDARVRRDGLVFHRRRGAPVRMPRLSATISDRHVEIQRDDLVSILYDAAAPHAEYLFDDTVTAVGDEGGGVAVEFQNSAPRTFDLVIGADGLHSRVRRLVFGPEERFRHDLGACLSVFSHANTLALDREVLGYADVDRTAFAYAVEDGRRARALLLFRPGTVAAVDLRDRRQRLNLVHDAFGDIEHLLPFAIDAAEESDDFYFDTISQLRMETWSHGRITLVGDAAYSPGPAVGGGTALAVLGAYVLADELTGAGGDHRAAYERTETVMRQPVAQSRKVGPSALARLVPRSRLAARTTPHLMKLLTRLPRSATRALFSLQGSGSHTLDDFSSAAAR